MRIGSLDRRITIQQPTRDADSFGGHDTTWTDLAEIWAAIVKREVSEQHEAEQEYATRSLTFRIRYRADVTEKMRVSYNSLLFDIRGLVEIGRREGLDIIAVAEVPA